MTTHRTDARAAVADLNGEGRIWVLGYLADHYSDAVLEACDAAPIGTSDGID